MSDVVHDVSDHALADAIYANLRVALTSLPRPSSLEPSDGPATCRWLLPFDHPWFRGVWSEAAPPDDADAEIAETIASFRAHGVTSFTWWLSRDVDREPWIRALTRNGLRLDDGPPGMAIDIHELAPRSDDSLEIRVVDRPDDLPTLTETMARGFGDLSEEVVRALLTSMGPPLPFRHYLGFLSDEPVATSTLFLGAGVAGIFNVATVPEARKRGFGTAMTRVPLLDAREMGYRVGVLQSSDLGAPVYRRMGFRDFGRIAHFVWGEVDGASDA